MTLSDSGWFSYGISQPGPRDRRYPWDNNLTIYVKHSMEGVRGSYSAMTDPSRFPTAWHGTVAYDGVLYQHYPIQAGLAHAGPNGNPYGPGFESEGFAHEPLTFAQVATWKRMVADLENAGMVGKEHRELAQTACPSGRYGPLYEEEDMTPAQLAMLEACYAALTGGVAGVIEAWNQNGNSMIVAYNDLVFPHVNNPIAHPHKHAGILATGEPKEIQE